MHIPVVNPFDTYFGEFLIEHWGLRHFSATHLYSGCRGVSCEVLTTTISQRPRLDRPIDFYRAMHYSAKRGLAIACRLSVCDVGGL